MESGPDNAARRNGVPPPPRPSASPWDWDAEGMAMWDSFSLTEKRDFILDHFPAVSWADEETLNVLAVFRDNPLDWMAIRARAAEIKVNIFDLDRACKAIQDRHTTWKKRQEAVQGTTPMPPVPQSMQGAEALRYLSSLWGLVITGVIQHGTDNGSTWHLQLDTGQEIALGKTEELHQQARVRARIFEVTHRLIPRIPAQQIADWDELMGIVGAVAEIVDTPELSQLGKIRTLLAAYCEAQNCDLMRDNSHEEWEILAQSKQPFVRQGRLHLSAQHLWSDYARVMAPELTQAEILEMLRLLGATRVTVMLHKFRTSRSCWILDDPATVIQGLRTDKEPILETTRA